ncbi:glycosyltransferase [Sediminicola luteus]|uniref:Glycosyltransferase n=1 Tax=Sediminicola luteus TaxID=319238 RepID=A0ABV2TZH6_9FLAO
MAKDNIKILFVLPTLMAGGAERIMTFLTKNLDNTIFDCTLIVIGSQQEIAYDTANLRIIFLNRSRVLYSIPSLIRCIKKEKPQIVMGTVSHLNLAIGLISYIFPNIHFLGRQAAISKISSYHSSGNKNYLFSFLLKTALRKLDYIICQSADMLQDCKDEFGIKEENLKIIRNPITDSFKVKTTNNIDTTNIHKFITVGRLSQIKGHERILEVLSKFELPFTYTIIGDGPKKNAILEKVDFLGLKDKVTFITFTREVSKYLSQSDFFLQGSFSEGFPNALLESCAVGTPVIAFNAPGGTGEIVENGINGFIVKDQEEFLDRLNNLEFFDPQKVSESVYKKFAKEIILNEYETFFQKIVDKQ